MLRLGEGWSAEKLSQVYKTVGAGALTRTTIAKIEGDNRQIKAGEVEGVARAFGLTSAHLLDPDGPDVFLSYAEQDDVAGTQVATWLTDHGFHVLSAGVPAAKEPGSGSGETRVIDAAQAFVVLLSPSYLSSPRCRAELDLAMRRERQLLATNSAAGFVYILRIAGGSDLDDSVLSSHVPIDVPRMGDRSSEVALSKLGSGIISSTRASAARANPPVQSQADDRAFLDRGEELERVLYGLGNPSGAHFWLVISPPGLGKSWFLEQLKDRAGGPAPGGWDTRMVDLRSGESATPDAVGGQHAAMAVIRSLFGIEQTQSSEPEDDLLLVTQKIISSGRPCLRLLDSAELLPASTVGQLRQHLGTIYRLIQDKGNANARLAVVVASRRDEGWTGVTPYPRVSVLRLTGFEPSAVQDALEALARRMPGVHSPAELREDAALVQRVTEGVPDLVQRSLEWIQTKEWLAIERLDRPPFFAENIAPYIRDRMLSQDSLLPGGGQPGARAKQLDALLGALRALAPYRLITLSHVNHHLDSDGSFRDSVKEASWSPEDLWRAIADIALLSRPLSEPWKQIHPAVRRLLYRYFYPPEQRLDAHLRARDFTADWAARLTGTDQAIGIVESIWYEAVRLKLSNVATLGAELTGFAQMVSSEVRSSPYSQVEVRDYAVQRMQNDDELQREVADFTGLFDTLVRVIRAPEAQEA